jgi:predicted flap endonuclease-1-like 5' DNA nuclease
LIERYRVRNEEAERLEAELEQARQRITELESAGVESDTGETRIEPVHHPAELTDGLDASNDPADDYVDEPDDDVVDDVVSAMVETGNDDVMDDDAMDDDVIDDDGNDDEQPPEFSEDLVHDEAEPNSRPGDDLQQIKGVGPAIEKTLNELGIVNLRQIANMSEYDIDRVARKLKGFHSRIYREDWIGQARELLNQSARA